MKTLEQPLTIFLLVFLILNLRTMPSYLSPNRSLTKATMIRLTQSLINLLPKNLRTILNYTPSRCIKLLSVWINLTDMTRRSVVIPTSSRSFRSIILSQRHTLTKVPFMLSRKTMTTHVLTMSWHCKIPRTRDSNPKFNLRLDKRTTSKVTMETLSSPTPNCLMNIQKVPFLVMRNSA